MAKSKTTLVKGTKIDGNLILRILVGLLFICIGIEGLLGDTSNGLFDVLDNEVLQIVFGVLYVKWSMVAVLVVWILTIIVTDFVEGLKGVNGDEWIYWLEELVTHLLVLACVWKVSSEAF